MEWSRHAAKRVGWAGLVVSCTMATTACGPEQTPLYAMTQDDTLALAWRVCPDAGAGTRRDGIVSLSVHPFTEGFDIESPPPAVWHVRASSPRVDPVAEVLVGSERKDFVTVVELATPLREGDRYAAIANADSHEQVLGYVAFRPDDLANGSVAFDEFRTESRDAYFDREATEFGCG